MKALAKYLLSLCILLVSGYIQLPVQTCKVEIPLINLQGSPANTHIVSTIQDHPTLRSKSTSTHTDRQAIKTDVVESEVEEEELLSKKQSEKYYHTTLLLSAQVLGLSLSNDKILSACKSFSYTPSYRYLIFRVFRI